MYRSAGRYKSCHKLYIQITVYGIESYSAIRSAYSLYTLKIKTKKLKPSYRFLVETFAYIYSTAR